MKYWRQIIMVSWLAIIFIGIAYNQGWLDTNNPLDKVKLPLYFPPRDESAFENIKEKCGVLDTDEIRTTSLRKISDCLNRLSNEQITVLVPLSGDITVDAPYNNCVEIGAQAIMGFDSNHPSSAELGHAIYLDCLEAASQQQAASQQPQWDPSS